MHVDDDAFVSLADLLRPPHGDAMTATVAQSAPDGQGTALAASDARPHGNAPGDLRASDAVATIASDVRLFGARLSDAFDAARDALLREFAYAVLGRELVLAAADVTAIAARVLAEHRLAQPLRIRIAPGDVFAIDAQCAALPPVVVDPDLAPGDAMIELNSGTIDARLGVRLASVLEHIA